MLNAGDRFAQAKPIWKELALAQDPKQPSVQAGLRLERAQKLAREGEKAMAEYEAAGRAADVKIARLKKLRLAKEAADRDTAEREAAEKKAAPVKAAKGKVKTKR
jgi:hypothetical protein